MSRELITPDAEAETEASPRAVGWSPAATLADGIAGATSAALVGALDRAVRAACDPELSPIGRSTDGCPYLSAWLLWCRSQPPERVEALLRAHTGAPAHLPTTALLGIVAQRARAGVQDWVRTGALPPGLPAWGASVVLQRWADGVPGATSAEPPESVQARLGPGQPLDPGIRARMEPGLGVALADVRIHTGAHAGRIADQLDAHAFTVGQDVAFAPGRFRPGEPWGDAILAHELAHTVQQRGGGVAPQAEAQAEAQADRAAEAVLGVGAAGARLSPGGLAIQRCKRSAPSRVVGPGPVSAETAPRQRHFIIVYGESGSGSHDTGRLNEIAAATHRDEVVAGTFPGATTFNAGTDTISVVGIATVNDLIASVGIGNVAYLAYFGHSGPVAGGTGALFIGSEATPGSNLTNRGGRNDQSPTTIPANNFRTDAQVRLFGCRGGVGADPIAQQMADQLRVPVYAYTNSGGAFFTDDPTLGHGERGVTQADIDKRFPARIRRLWLIPINGTPTFRRFGGP